MKWRINHGIESTGGKNEGGNQLNIYDIILSMLVLPSRSTPNIINQNKDETYTEHGGQNQSHEEATI